MTTLRNMSETEPETPYHEPEGGQDREPTEKPDEDKHPDAEQR
jgi:hypothetical protein